MSRWRKICSEILDYDYIREYSHKVNWEKVCRVTINRDPITPYSFLREFKDKIRWDLIIKVPREERFFEEFGHLLSGDCWAYLIGNKEIYSDELLLRFVNVYYSWKAVIAFRDLSEEFMEEYSNYLDWNGLSYHQKMSEDFIEKHIDKINPHQLIGWKKNMSEKHLRGLIFNSNKEIAHEWSNGSKQDIRTIDFLREFRDKIDWDTYIIQHNIKQYPPNFYKEFTNKLHFDMLEGCVKMDEQFIERYAEQWNWENIMGCQNLSEKCIKRNIGRLKKLDTLFYNQRPSEKFIEWILKHQKRKFNLTAKKNWTLISTTRDNLSEAFIEKHANEVSWYEILTKQKVSPEFMKKWLWKLTEFEMNSFERWLKVMIGEQNAKDILESQSTSK